MKCACRCTATATATAQRQLRAVDRTSAPRILTALTRLGDDPYRDEADVEKLSGHDGFRSL